MDDEQIQAAKRDAQAVVDGFVTPKARQAQNVLRLAAVLELRNRQFEKLRVEIAKREAIDRLKRAGVKGGDSPFAGIFDDIFGKGKS